MLGSIRGNLSLSKGSHESLLEKKVRRWSKKKLYNDLQRDNRIIRANPCKKELFIRPYLIFENGINISPKSLADSEYTSNEVQQGKSQHTPMPLSKYKLLELKSVDSMSSALSFQSLVSVSRMSIKKSVVSRPSATYSMASLEGFSRDNISFVAAVEHCDQEEEKFSSPAPSMYRLREDPPPKKPEQQSKFKINLVETDTIFLLQIPSVADSLETENGKEISESNDAYEKSLEKSKALSHIAVQTTKFARKHRKVYKTKNTRANAGAFASVWDMYDTYEALGVSESESMLNLSTRAEGRVADIVATVEHQEYDPNVNVCGQTFNSRLLNSLMLLERLVTRDNYSKSQLRYQGLFVQNPFANKVFYNYTLTHLWTFSCNHVRKRAVTSMSWNPKNKNILAVGYGKFRFTTKCDGAVYIWNVKSPSIPERRYDFANDPVTFVTFSNYRSHILAVTFYGGTVLLIDVIARCQLIKANNHHYPHYHPVRQARWFPSDHQSTVLLTCGKGGRVFRYKKSEFFISNKIMTLGRPHGKIHGIEQPRKCFARRVLGSRQPAAEVLVRHPVDPQTYLVGSAEGCVYVCSVQHRHDYSDIFVAHNGPVYNIQFNPFCSKIFLTCGADWCIRIWAESIFEPLITLESGMTAVQDALWSPLHSTVIVSTTGTCIEMWDIRRRISKPMSSFQTPSQSQNNVLMFSPNKFNICVGDADGNVHVMALSEMPFSPSFQEVVLVESIWAALIIKPDILHSLRKLGPPFDSRGNEDDYKTKLIRRLNKLHKYVV